MHQLARRVPGGSRRQRDFGCCSANSPAEPSQPLSQPRAAAARGGAVTQQQLPAQRPPPAEPPGRAPRRVLSPSVLSSASRRGKAQPGPRSVPARAPRGPPAPRRPAPKYPAGARGDEGETAARGGGTTAACRAARLAATCLGAARRAGPPRQADTRRCSSFTPRTARRSSKALSLLCSRCHLHAPTRRLSGLMAGSITLGNKYALIPLVSEFFPYFS